MNPRVSLAVAAITMVLGARTATGAIVISRAITAQSLSSSTPGPAGQPLSRVITLQNLGTPGPAHGVLARLFTAQDLGVPSPPSARPFARVFTLYRDDPTADGPTPDEHSAPLVFMLRPAHPNPVYRAAQLEYSLAEARRVRLLLYDAAGRRVRQFADGSEQPAGRHVVTWNGTDDDGEPLPAGFYWLRLTAGRFEGTRRIVLLRD